MQKVLISDLDNTLYNWMDFFAPSFRGMVHALSREMKIDEETLYEQFKKVFSKTGSVEYSYSIQEIDACKDLSDAEVQKLVNLGRGAFRRVRQRNLVPYEGVIETLKWATDNAIKIIGISNAPLFHVMRRLTNLHIDKYFFGLGAWEGNFMPRNKFATQIEEKVKNNSYRSRVKKSWEFTNDELKPSSAGYKKVISDLNIDISNVYVIGDSLAKDIEPAMDLGAIGIWAKYGLDFQTKNYETILRISPWTDKHQEEAYKQFTKEPDFTVNSFLELKNIITPSQLKIF
jgi:FMN phosphatase YigB (HAD superfamily)